MLINTFFQQNSSRARSRVVCNLSWDIIFKAFFYYYFCSSNITFTLGDRKTFIRQNYYVF